ncbi:hypothetical protein [Actinacidiphila soli]|uniref:hypothetical protein n=1 Tax=Actinacidiphila soli TaxID=2487275 RepID=UPI000FCCCD0D|nr:hypothetical protein [Actinacidiphila soli]
MPEPQPVIVRRILRGEHTPHDVEKARANFQRWLSEQWNGDERRAIAFCLGALADACGRDWNAMPERDALAHVWLFSFLCPRSVDLDSREVDLDSLDFEAREYRDVMLRSPGGFREFAKRIRLVRGEPE